MTKSKTIAAALAALTLATTFMTFGHEAQARPRWGWVGAGIAAGVLIGAAAAANSYGYRECRYVERLDRWGNVYTVKVCDY
jgi:hypothetical protein